ncbi:MAG: hypothetical protein IT305_26780 [Chloroflexi bacterium]|nr:hypothetical protein [Chloroflexota bacterium]
MCGLSRLPQGVPLIPRPVSHVSRALTGIEILAGAEASEAFERRAYDLEERLARLGYDPTRAR